MNHSVKDRSPPAATSSSSTADGDFFQADPLLECLLREGHTAPGLTVPLVAAWPIDASQWCTPYQQLIHAFQECWDPSDLPSLYCYPWQALHVTIATCYRDISQPISQEKRVEVIQTWKRVLEYASNLPSWPKRPMELVIDSARIGNVACILLWKETTGGMQAIRDAIRQAVHEIHDLPQHAKQTLSIPNIVHSTFCRFHKTPQSSMAGHVQDCFQTKVVNQLQQFFPRPITVPMCKLVSELRPYMHIPDDDEHVHATIDLAQQ